jgi:hypothetical protein
MALSSFSFSFWLMVSMVLNESCSVLRSGCFTSKFIVKADGRSFIHLCIITSVFVFIPFGWLSVIQYMASYSFYNQLDTGHTESFHEWFIVKISKSTALICDPRPGICDYTHFTAALLFDCCFVLSFVTRATKNTWHLP